MGDADARRAAARRSSPPPARRWSTRPSSAAAPRSTSTPRRARTALEVFVRDRGPGFDPAARARRPPRRARVDRRPHGAPRRPRGDPQRAGRGHRGRARARARRGGAAMSRARASRSSTTTRCSARACAASCSEHVDVAGEAATVDEAVALIAAERPDVVLLDVHMPDGGGVEVIRRVAPRRPRRRCFLALSVSDAAEDVIAVIRAGARGYVTKTISGRRPGRRHPPRARRRRRVLAAPGRLRARRVRRRAAARAGRRLRPRPAHARASARSSS